MKIIQTKFNGLGPVQIQDHGSAFLVSFPCAGDLGSSHYRRRSCYQRERLFDKIFPNAWNQAQAFAAEKRREDGSDV